MRLTEEEAKTKECRQFPGAFVPMKTGGAIAIHSDQQIAVGFGKCVASNCAGWRWALSFPGEDLRGYCGFAGKWTVE